MRRENSGSVRTIIEINGEGRKEGRRPKKK